MRVRLWRDDSQDVLDTVHLDPPDADAEPRRQRPIWCQLVAIGLMSGTHSTATSRAAAATRAALEPLAVQLVSTPQAGEVATGGAPTTDQAAHDGVATPENTIGIALVATLRGHRRDGGKAHEQSTPSHHRDGVRGERLRLVAPGDPPVHHIVAALLVALLAQPAKQGSVKIGTTPGLAAERGRGSRCAAGRPAGRRHRDACGRTEDDEPACNDGRTRIDAPRLLPNASPQRGAGRRSAKLVGMVFADPAAA